jgi:hypothetical protein
MTLPARLRVPLSLSLTGTSTLDHGRAGNVAAAGARA